MTGVSGTGGAGAGGGQTLRLSPLQPPWWAQRGASGDINFYLNSISLVCLKTTGFSFHWKEEQCN